MKGVKMRKATGEGRGRGNGPEKSPVKHGRHINPSGILCATGREVGDEGLRGIMTCYHLALQFGDLSLNDHPAIKLFILLAP